VEPYELCFGGAEPHGVLLLERISYCPFFGSHLRIIFEICKKNSIAFIDNLDSKALNDGFVCVQKRDNIRICNKFSIIYIDFTYKSCKMCFRLRPNINNVKINNKFFNNYHEIFYMLDMEIHLMEILDLLKVIHSMK